MKFIQKTFFTILLMQGLLVGVAVAQSSLKGLRETFDNNKNKWFVGKGKDYDNRIEDGQYHMYSKRTKGFYYPNQRIYIDPRKDFSISMKLTQISGAETYGAGILYGSNNDKNRNFFIVSPSGSFRIAQVKRGKLTNVVDWSKHSAIKAGLGKTNNLAVEKRGSTVKYKINGVTVKTIPATALLFFGTKQGFIVYNTKEVKVDDFFITHAPYRINVIANAIQGYKKENLGTNINSPYNDIAPLISSDGQTLYFVRKDHPDNIKRKKDDIWYAEQQPDGTWGKAKNIGKPLNNTSYNGVIAVSPDGNTVLVTGVYKADGSYKENGISISHRTNSGWEVPKKVSVKNFYNKNGYYAFNLSSDRRKLILAVERDDSRGDLDLYVSFLKQDGSWTEPKNMGNDLNTFGRDSGPFLAADDKTLYFSSSGHPGYGSSDIYVTKRLDDTWTRWSKPKNLGKEVNSSGGENGFTITAKGDYAYLVSWENKKNGYGLFRIKLHQAAKPEPVVMVYGKVLNRKTGRPLSARIRYSDLNSGKLLGIARSNPSTGSYKIILPYSKAYDFLATRQGFYSVGNHLDLKASSSFKAVKRNLYLAPIQVGANILLNNLFFDTGKSTLKTTSYGELNRLIRSLKRYPKMTIEIAGHTDSQGNPGKNMTLSKARASAVLGYLSSKGIPASRLKAKGYGQNKPIAKNTTALGRARNRRVEFTILTK